MARDGRGAAACAEAPRSPVGGGAAATITGDEPRLAGVLAVEVGGEDGRYDAFIHGIHEIARDPGLHADERGVGTALLREGVAAARGGRGAT